MGAAIRRIQTHLAHASAADMRKIVQAARAPQAVMNALVRFSRDQCDAMTQTKNPRGVPVPLTVAPLRHVAMDVEWLPSWEEDLGVKAVNIIDKASKLQHKYPFFETETSEEMLRQYRNWTNMGETLQRALEANGTQLMDIPGEAHEQAGRVEVHGRYFEDLLLRVLAQVRPETRTEGLECVAQTMEATNSLIRKCGCSPFQIAIGRDPGVPGDLLQDLAWCD